MTHLHDAVQTDLKRLLRNPPPVKLPTKRDFATVHPLLGSLPSEVCEPLAGSTKEIMKLRGVTLYKEGSKPNGIWLVSNGVVKWASNSTKNKHSLHPTFSHGSTLGLYEVLTGKPYMCDMITESVVLCFFVEAMKILELLGSDSAVEDFLWQECSILLSKVLLPQVFEKMPMQEMRAMVAERSTITIYLSGETIEIPQHSIGFLLEGFVKKQGVHEELVTSPTALLPSGGDPSFFSSEMPGAKQSNFFLQGSCYQVQTRARVIIFDIAAFEAHRPLQGRSPSIVSIDHHPPRTLSKRHSGLMSWPEHFYKARLHPYSPDEKGKQPKNLSARAMQLSIFGSMINKREWDGPSASRIGKTRPSHSQSYPRVPSSHGQPLLSGRSEWSTMRKNLEVQHRTGGQDPAHQLRSSITREINRAEESSDESGPEDELIVKIDSPSRLSFRHAS
ncbi:hypothetical protein NMG60_11030674 [Bertholletia excelsa]